MAEPSPESSIVVLAYGVEIDARLAAEKLGLPPELFWENLRQGIVFGLVERGEGEDAGRVRITLRCRARSWSTIVVPSVKAA